MLQYLKKLTLLTLTLTAAIAANAQNATDTVSLVVSGQGATLEEARTNALRSAIEQAYGAFISSKTELLNDSLVKDEVVSVASGNILGYETQSQISIPGGGYGITLRAMVSLKKLTSFVESKGGNVDIKGAVFAANMKLKLLNEKAELAAVLNICDVSWKILSKSVDFDLEVAQTPQLVNKDEQIYSLPILIKAKTNENKTAFYNYFIGSLKVLSIKNNELESYKSSSIPYFIFCLPDQKIFLRSDNSILALTHLLLKSNVFFYYFKLISNIDTITISDNFPFERICVDEFRGIDPQKNTFTRSSSQSAHSLDSRSHVPHTNHDCNPIISFTIYENEEDLFNPRYQEYPYKAMTEVDFLYDLSHTIYPKLQSCASPDNFKNIFDDVFFTDRKWQTKDEEMHDFDLRYYCSMIKKLDVNRTSYFNTTLNRTLKLSELELLEGYRIEKINLSGN